MKAMGNAPSYHVDVDRETIRVPIVRGLSDDAHQTDRFSPHSPLLLTEIPPCPPPAAATAVGRGAFAVPV